MITETRVFVLPGTRITQSRADLTPVSRTERLQTRALVESGLMSVRKLAHEYRWSDYPTGVAVSKERMASLPLERHATHGAWNYTLHPCRVASPAGAAPASESRSAARHRQAVLAKLADPRLTGMTAAQLEQLAAALGPRPGRAGPAAVQPAARRPGPAGHRKRPRQAAVRRRGPAAAHPALPKAGLLHDVLADLLEVTATCIGDLVKETRGILEDHGHDPGVAPVRFTTRDALLAFADSDLRPARATVIEQLSHPALTGLTPRELHDLTARLAARQSAHAERLTYQRRGGLRQPGTRGGVFHQKISNSERILLALLYHRRLCTLDVLADALGGVSRSAVGNVIRETLPLLREEDRIPAPAPARYCTAADLFTAAATSDTATS